MAKKIQRRGRLEGLNCRQKGGRHSKISRQAEYMIQAILKENNNQGWTTKQVEEMILQERGIRYHPN